MRAALVDVLCDLSGGVVGVVVVGDHGVVLGVFQTRQTIEAVIRICRDYVIRQGPRSQPARGVVSIARGEIRAVGDLRQTIHYIVGVSCFGRRAEAHLGAAVIGVVS